MISIKQELTPADLAAKIDRFWSVSGEKIRSIQLAADWQIDYNTYKSQFSEHQLCWAHFLRKAIAISLRNPDNRQYAMLAPSWKSLFSRKFLPSEQYVHTF